MPDDHDDVFQRFRQAVNMTPGKLEKWLDTDDSKRGGWKGMDGHGDGESVGHKEGRVIVELLHKKKGELSDDDLAQMKKVLGYIARHSAQGGPAHDKETSDWRYSLMNWGHDPCK